jgi:hypothetical protein
MYLGVSAVAAMLPAGAGHAQSQRAMQEQYCMGDAFRLCSSEIPDEARVEMCMTRQRHLLSPACRAVFDDSAPGARARPVRPGQPKTE